MSEADLIKAIGSDRVANARLESFDWGVRHGIEVTLKPNSKGKVYRIAFRVNPDEIDMGCEVIACWIEGVPK